jgi:uncharacterized protein YigA (DUF484 family)
MKTERYVIKVDKEDGGILLLADRNKTKELWWTDNWFLAFRYFNKEAANKRAGELTNPKATVITLEEARRILEPQFIQ